MNSRTSSVPDLSVFVDYEYEIQLGANNAGAYVLDVVGSEKRVLEIGAGSGSITRRLVGINNCDVTAVEINPKSVAKLKNIVERVYQLDLNDSGWVEAISAEGKFDVVLAADVLEHLYDPWAVIKQMTSLLNDTGSIVLSLPHVGHVALMSAILRSDYPYQEFGLLDKTHIRFFGLRNIVDMYKSVGFAVTDARFVLFGPHETEFAADWERVSPAMRTMLSRAPHGRVYQVVTRAQRAELVPEPLDLLAASLRAAERHPTIAPSGGRLMGFFQKLRGIFGL